MLDKRFKFPHPCVKGLDDVANACAGVSRHQLGGVTQSIAIVVWVAVFIDDIGAAYQAAPS